MEFEIEILVLKFQQPTCFSVCDVFLSFSHLSRKLWDFDRVRKIEISYRRRFPLKEHYRPGVECACDTWYGTRPTDDVEVISIRLYFCVGIQWNDAFSRPKTGNTEREFRNNIALFEPEYLACLSRYERFSNVEYQ